MRLRRIKTAAGFPDIELGTVGTTTVGDVTVEVIDSTEEHVSLLWRCFDKAALRALVARRDFSMKLDAMHGVQGPYARRVFVEELGAPADCLLNCQPKEDFGGPSTPSHGHADPNLKNARELCDLLGLLPDGAAADTGEATASFGAAWDGDADR